MVSAETLESTEGGTEDCTAEDSPETAHETEAWRSTPSGHRRPGCTPFCPNAFWRKSSGGSPHSALLLGTQ